MQVLPTFFGNLFKLTAQNLLLWSEVYTNPIWQKQQITVDDNFTADDEGSMTAARITATATTHIITQHCTIDPGLQYTFSFYAKRGTMPDAKYSVYDMTNGADILAPTSYYAQINSDTWTRISVTFTVPNNCTQVAVYQSRDTAATGNMFIAKAHLNKGTTAVPYVKTTSFTI